jgi:hypothetical protein
MSRVPRIALVAASLLWAAAAGAQTVRPDFPITNGTVNAQVLSGTTLYVGGSFSSVGPVTGSGAPVDTTTGLATAGFPRVIGQINAAISDGAGGWYIGGSFSTVGAVARSNVAHVRADHSVSPWNPGTNGVVRVLTLAGGTVYLGGDFTTVSGQTRNRIAAVDTATGTPSAWNPNANSPVRTIVVNGGDVLVGGQFTSIGGQTRNRIAALSAGTGLATAWNPDANSSVFALALAGTSVYAAGQFTSIGGQLRNRIAALDLTSGAASAWNPNANNQVLALAAGGSTVYVGGLFTSVGGQTRGRIAALDATTGLATSWNPNASSTVQSLALAGSTLYAGGDFLSIGGQARSRVAALSVATGLATPWDPTAYGTVVVVALDGPDVFVGGLFNSVGGWRRNNLAAFDVTTGQATAWNPDANNMVLALALKQGMVYVGGAFTAVGGQPRGGLAAVDSTLGIPTGWNPGTDGQVTALAADGSSVYIGGLFGNVGGQVRFNLAAVDAGTGLVTPWDPEADDQVFAIEPVGGTVYVGGNFLSVGGQARDFIAALNASNGLATAWNPDANGTVRALAIGCDRIYAGGFFTTIGGQPRNRIAALSGATGLAMAWNPNANGPVFTLALSGGVAYVGGVFSQIGALTRNRIGAIDPVTGVATPWDPNCNGTVRVITVGGGSAYVAGTFTSMGVSPSGNVAAVSADTSAACPVITLASSPPPGVVSTFYSQSLAAAGGSAPYCYAVAAGSLPAGLALSSSSGLLSGTPTTPGANVFTVSATDARGCGGSQTYSLSIFAGPSNSSVAANGSGICITPMQPCAGVPVFYTRGEAAPVRAISVTFQIDPSKLALCTPGSPSASIHPGTWLGSFTNSVFQVTANGGGSYTVDQTLLGVPCGITTGGQLFVMDLKSVGPGGAGAITVTSVTARDCSNVPIAVSAGPGSSVNILTAPIVVTPSTLPQTTVGASYSQAFGASPGTAPFSFAVTAGSLPTGLTLTTGGLLAGTPIQSGVFAFTVTATDAGGCAGATACSLTVTCPPLALTPSGLPAGAIGAAYGQTITTSGGLAPFHYAVTAGTLPAGLTLSTSGVLSGTPTAAGTFVFTISVTDTAGCTGGEDYVVDIFATPPVSSVAANTAGLFISDATPCVSVPFEYARGESAAVRAVQVSFQIDASMLSLCTPGTPAASVHAGTWFGGFTNRQILVTDHGAGSYTVDLTLLGEPCGITNGGTLFSLDLQSVAGDGAGAITVTQVKVRDCGNAAVPVMAGPQASLRIQHTPIDIAPAVLPGVIAGQPYTQTLTATPGVAPFTFTISAGALPPGITLSSAGVLSGTSIVTGTYAFTVRATDATGVPGTRAYTLGVVCPAFAVLPDVLPAGVVGVAYSQTLVTNGGTAPFAWTITGGTLPAGLTLDPATGEIGGTPLAGGVTVFTATVTDTAGCTSSATYTFSVFSTPPVSSIAAHTDGLCLSAAHACVGVPVRFDRGESAPARAASVRFQLETAKLSLCTPGAPASSIHPGTWLSGFANTSFQVTDHGSGAYTVDYSILGTPCGATVGGLLFTVDLQPVGGDGSGTITVTAVTVRDCDNAPIAVATGPAASLPINNSPPAPITDLAATPLLTGNGAGATTRIALTWSTGDSGLVRLYRAPFGAYPLYDALGPVTPPDPSASPGAPWTLIATDPASGFIDATAPRGFWHYVARVENACGIVSPPSNMTTGTLDYLLGDVSNSVTRGTGNNRVGMEDVTLLGANYGITGATLTTRGVEYLDVGPTVGASLTGRPLPDRKLDFEDLFIFAGNFDASMQVPQMAAKPARAAPVRMPRGAGSVETDATPARVAGAPEEFWIDAPALVTAGEVVTVTLGLRAGARIQGFSARLGWNAGVVEPLVMQSGGFIENQGGVVLTPQPGTVDAALLGLRARGIEGEGTVATVTFRALRTGDAGIRIANVVARDAANRPLGPGDITQSGQLERPLQTLLLAPTPNPLQGEARLTFALSEPGEAELVIYGVDGRRVRVLASGWRDAGLYHVTWDGRDESHRSIGAGVFYARLTAGGRRYTQKLVYLK